MRLLASAIVLLLFGSCLAGCEVGIKDKGAWYVEFGTRIEVGSEASATNGEESTSRVEIAEWLRKKGGTDSPVDSSPPPG